MTTIVIGEAQPVIRDCLRTLLAAERGFQVVGATGDGRVLLEMLMQLRPQVLLVNPSLRGFGGPQVLREVALTFPQTRIVVCSVHETPAYAAEAFLHGASGYVVVTGDLAHLARGIREVCAGRRYVGLPLTEDAIRDYLRRAAAGEPGRPAEGSDLPGAVA